MKRMSASKVYFEPSLPWAVMHPTQAWRIFVPVMMPARPGPAATPAAAPVAAAKAAIVIKRGDPVTVVAGDGAFSVTRDGIATTDAAAGARVLIRVQDGKPPIQAIAVEPGKAMIPGAE